MYLVLLRTQKKKRSNAVVGPHSTDAVPNLWQCERARATIVERLRESIRFPKEIISFHSRHPAKTFSSSFQL